MKNASKKITLTLATFATYNVITTVAALASGGA